MPTALSDDEYSALEAKVRKSADAPVVKH